MAVLSLLYIGPALQRASARSREQQSAGFVVKCRGGNRCRSALQLQLCSPSLDATTALFVDLARFGVRGVLATEETSVSALLSARWRELTSLGGLTADFVILLSLK